MNDGTRIHYAVAGAGPLVVFAHGFPGWWWTWRQQMSALMSSHTVAALDMRGYADSGRPRSSANYRAPVLAYDIAAVIRHAGFSEATVVGHDFGGAAAWTLAAFEPALVSHLAVLNSPHPALLLDSLHRDPNQRRAFRYAQALRRHDAATRPMPAQISRKMLNIHRNWSAEPLALILAVTEQADYQTHLAAMRRSSLRAAFAYYRANIPAAPYPRTPTAVRALRVQTPTLMIWGMRDEFLLPALIDGSHAFIDGSFELVRVPAAGHFVHNDAPEAVSTALSGWLERTSASIS